MTFLKSQQLRNESRRRRAMSEFADLNRTRCKSYFDGALQQAKCWRCSNANIDGFYYRRSGQKVDVNQWVLTETPGISHFKMRLAKLIPAHEECAKTGLGSKYSFASLAHNARYWRLRALKMPKGRKRFVFLKIAARYGELLAEAIARDPAGYEGFQRLDAEAAKRRQARAERHAKRAARHPESPIVPGV